MVDLQAKTIEMLQEDVWKLHAKIRKLETLVKELLRSSWDSSWPTMRKYDTFEEYENAVLEGKE
jgi:tetrahydromethanopterin S-methyltransferase subunit B